MANSRGTSPTSDSAPARTPIRRVERALLFAFPTVIALGVVCIVIVIVVGVSGGQITSTGIGPTIVLLPEIAFPIAILLVIAYVVVSAIRRSREARGGAR
ncbi:hypothetical protein [Frondihabitans australicus]|uniref:hypothetical protein n=1 Tax=Frondihabitans australicus TaxID=386892 RepID=UPI0011C40785|nr:hypothetical protein [Frondihabitans australicus]